MRIQNIFYDTRKKIYSENFPTKRDYRNEITHGHWEARFVARFMKSSSRRNISNRKDKVNRHRTIFKFLNHPTTLIVTFQKSVSTDFKWSRTIAFPQIIFENSSIQKWYRYTLWQGHIYSNIQHLSSIIESLNVYFITQLLTLYKFFVVHVKCTSLHLLLALQEVFDSCMPLTRNLSFL